VERGPWVLNLFSTAASPTISAAVKATRRPPSPTSRTPLHSRLRTTALLPSWAGTHSRWRRAGLERRLAQGKSAEPAHPSIDNGLCWGYALDGEAQAALPHCEAAVAADPTGSSFDSRAIVYSDLGRLSGAAADLKQYLLWVQSEHPNCMPNTTVLKRKLDRSTRSGR